MAERTENFQYGEYYVEQDGTIIGFHCPKCEAYGYPARHGKNGHCRNCGARFILWGNRLEVTTQIADDDAG